MSLGVSIITIGLNPAIDRVIEVPDLQPGQHLTGRLITRLPAGKAMNVSRVLASLGCDSVATGFVGRDEYPLFEKRLNDSGPGRALCQLITVAGRTRENITLLDPENHVDTHIRDIGFEVTEQDVQRITSKINLLARDSTYMVFSGSLPPGVSQSAFAAMVKGARSAGANVVLDLAGKELRRLIRPGGSDPAEPVTPGNEASSAEDERAKPPFFLIKPNLSELSDLVGKKVAEGDTNAAAEAARSLTQYSQWVCVTLGGAGAILLGRDGGWQGSVDVNEDDIQSTVGCGDAMLAGMLEGFCRQQPPEVVLQQGLAAATSNALTPGVAEVARADYITMLKQTAVSTGFT